MCVHHHHHVLLYEARFPALQGRVFKTSGGTLAIANAVSSGVCDTGVIYGEEIDLLCDRSGTRTHMATSFYILELKQHTHDSISHTFGGAALRILLLDRLNGWREVLQHRRHQ